MIALHEWRLIITPYLVPLSCTHSCCYLYPYYYVFFVSHAGISDATLLIALISVTCTLAVVSVSMFVIGVSCGYHLKMRTSAVNNKNVESSSIRNPASEHMGDLQLKENVAYVTIRPK